MKLLDRHSIPSFLIFGSLVLLLLFQGVWLNSTYEQEKEQLREQADRVFMDAVREIEDSILRIAILDIDQLLCDDTTNFTDMQVAFGIQTDHVTQIKNSVQPIRTNLQKYTSNINKDSILKIDIRTSVKSYREDKAFGSLSFFIATSDSSDSFSHPFLEDCDSINLTKQLLEEELASLMPGENLPENYRLAVLDQEEKEPGLYSNTQQDILRGGNYALFFPNYRMFLLKKILPQILFSALLFSVILLSFFMIWQSLQKQKRLTALKNDFISNVTHELKTPITTVGVAIEALSSFNAMDNPARTKEYLNISKHELDRLTILVDKVLKMSLFEKKEPELKIEAFDFHVLVNEVLGSMKLQFEKFAAKVNLKIEGSSFLLEGDRIHLTSVVYNLIDNALKYSPKSPEIDLLLKEEQNSIRLFVKDKGIGIPEAYKNKIFEKFFRVPTGDQHDIKGHGLGLSYVAGVINKHRGDINVDSQKNRGTQFNIRLPKVYE